MPRRPSSRFAAQRGVTLIELMTTLTVAAVLLAVGVPSFQQLVQAQRMRTASYDLISDLVLARSEALKRSVAVQVLPAAGGWDGGWTVQAAGGTEPLAQHNGLGGVLVTTAPANVTFDLNGRVSFPTATARIELSDGKSRARCISLDPAGRPKSMAQECPT